MTPKESIDSGKLPAKDSFMGGGVVGVVELDWEQTYTVYTFLNVSLCIRVSLVVEMTTVGSYVLLCSNSSVLFIQQFDKSIQKLLATRIAVYLMTFLIVTVAWAAHTR